MKSILHDFGIFLSPHTGGATEPILCELSEGLSILSKSRAIMTDTGADISLELKRFET